MPGSLNSLLGITLDGGGFFECLASSIFTVFAEPVGPIGSVLSAAQITTDYVSLWSRMLMDYIEALGITYQVPYISIIAGSVIILLAVFAAVVLLMSATTFIMSRKIFTQPSKAWQRVLLGLFIGTLIVLSFDLRPLCGCGICPSFVESLLTSVSTFQW